MILRRKPTQILILLVLLLLISIVCLAVVPMPVEVSAKSTRTVRLNALYLKCCQALMDDAVQKQLLETTGVVAEDTEKDPRAKTGSSWLSGGSKFNLFTGSYKNSEDFRVNCETSVGPVQLALRQDTSFNLSELQVSTYSLVSDEKVKLYKHELRLEVDKDATAANVELEMRVQLSVPWLWHSLASSRLAQTVDSQVDDFATRMTQLIAAQ